MGRPDFKSGERRLTSLVGSTPSSSAISSCALLRHARSALLIVVSCCGTAVLAEQKCGGRFEGVRIEANELLAIQAQHNFWRSRQQGILHPKHDLSKIAQFANLCGAVLIQVKAPIQLPEANFNAVRMGGVTFSKALLNKATFVSARISNSDFSSAWLDEVDLEGASLRGVNLKGATLKYANLRGAHFSEVRPGYLPEATAWQAAKNLQSVILGSDGGTLGEFRRLRETFKKSGMRSEERAITAALQRAEARSSGAFERAFKYVAFDLPSEYGNAPGRPLLILAVGILVFSFPYALALRVSRSIGTGAIWRVWPKDRLTEALGEEAKEKQERLSGLKVPQAIVHGLYFSLLSAFHFGYRDLSVGNWIARVQAQEYTLRASGWVRATSGVQSLVSVYLVALWALTYFGRPFE